MSGAPTSGHPPSPASGRLPSLTGLRFLLACPVVWYHMTFSSEMFDGSLHKGLGTVFPFAAGAVSGFFVLSGFVLAWVHRPGDRLGAFLRRRWWKIFPNHLLGWTAALVFFAVTVAQVPLAAPPGHDTTSALTSLFLVQAWVPDGDVFGGFNTPAWSISCELFFYALFPALIVLVRKIPAERLRRVWSGLAAVILLMPLVSTLVPGPKLYDWFPINEHSMWFIYNFPPVRLLEFVLGIVTARMLQTGTWPRVSRWVIAGGFVVLVLALPALPPQYTFCTGMAPMFAALIAKIAVADLEDRSRLLRRPALITLGDASFALYITHFPLMMAVRHALGADPSLSTGARFGVVFGMIAVSVALSVVIFRYFELPLMRRFSKSRGERRTTGRPAPEPAAPSANPDPEQERAPSAS
ncbi:acyltransferase [Streptomyces sp. NPDC052114]|uniref:acyltransferase family protein n=1 Tax=unclassified Streptomyces TaxID=2593676 RepID=UPI003430F953